MHDLKLLAVIELGCRKPLKNERQALIAQIRKEMRQAQNGARVTQEILGQKFKEILSRLGNTPQSSFCGASKC